MGALLPISLAPESIPVPTVYHQPARGARSI